MDLKQLAYFVRVAELGSFTRAAQALDVAQPALSRQVRLLEVELRQNLLVRNGRGAVPTEAGRLLLEHGRGILHQVERAREELGRVRGALAGRVAIGLPTDWLRTGRLDIAVLYNAPPSDELEAHPLEDEELLLVQARPAGLAEEPPPGPVSLAEVARLPLVIPSRPNAVRMLVEAELAGIGERPKVALEIDGVSAILDLVADGVGVALLPRNAVDSSVRPSAYRTRAVVDPVLRTRLSTATSSLRPTTLTQQSAIELIRQTWLTIGTRTRTA